MGLLRFLLVVAVAAVAVVGAHCNGHVFGISFTRGHIAVQVFYIISGFYMAMVLNEKYVYENKSYQINICPY